MSLLVKGAVSSRSDISLIYRFVFCHLEMFFREQAQPYIDDGLIREKVEGLTSEQFYSLYTPDCKTIAVSLPSTIPGILPAAVSRFQNNAPNLNVVFLPSLYYFPRLLEVHRGRYSISVGGLLDKNGSFHIGKFPEAIELDAIEACQFCREGISLLEDTIPQINGSHARLHTFKEKNLPLLQLDHEAIVPSVVIEKSAYIDVRQTISSLWHSYRGGVVIKPGNGSLGNDVFMISGNESIDHLIAQTTRQLALSNSVIIQPWVKSICLLDDNPKNRLHDWNLRIVSGDSGYIAIEARINKWGKPVNKHTGAKVVSLNDLFQLLSKNTGESLKRTLREFEETAISIAGALSSHFIGLDVIFTEDHLLKVIEVSTVNSGGVGTLTLLEGRFDGACLKLLQSIENSINRSLLLNQFGPPIELPVRLHSSDAVMSEMISVVLYAAMKLDIWPDQISVGELDAGIKFLQSHTKYCIWEMFFQLCNFLLDHETSEFVEALLNRSAVSFSCENDSSSRRLALLHANLLVRLTQFERAERLYNRALPFSDSLSFESLSRIFECGIELETPGLLLTLNEQLESQGLSMDSFEEKYFKFLNESGA